MRPSKLELASSFPSGLQASACTAPPWSESRCTSVADVTFQIWMSASSPLLASRLPSGAKAKQLMLEVCRCQSRVTCPLCSPCPQTICSPCPQTICSPCPQTADRVPRSRSHSLRLPSQLPLASVRSSGLKARVDVVSVCACQTRCKVRPPSRHTRTSPRLLPAAQYRPV